MKNIITIPVFAITISLTSCASNVPNQIRGDFSSTNVNENNENLLAKKVRWSGFVLESSLVNNKKCYNIVEAPLNKNLTPKFRLKNDADFFIACSELNIDKSNFENSYVTVIGDVIGHTQNNENFPVIAVEYMHKWKYKGHPSDYITTSKY